MLSQQGVPADPDHGAALLIHADEKGDAAVALGGGLVALDIGADRIRREPGALGVLEIPAEEEVTA